MYLVLGTIPNSSDSSEKSSDHKRSVFKPRLMHLISVGFDVMVLETWLDICTGTAKHDYTRRYYVRLNNTGLNSRLTDYFMRRYLNVRTKWHPLLQYSHSRMLTLLIYKAYCCKYNYYNALIKTEVAGNLFLLYLLMKTYIIYDAYHKNV